MYEKSNCTCERCVSACRLKPGWFAPREAELAAESMGMSLQEFFDGYLLVDYWFGDDDIFVLSPCVVEASPGSEFPYNPYGTCVFFENDRCSIYNYRPYECARTLVCGGEDYKELHHDVAMMWAEHQAQPIELLGEKPNVSPTLDDALDLLESMLVN